MKGRSRAAGSGRRAFRALDPPGLEHAKRCGRGGHQLPLEGAIKTGSFRAEITSAVRVRDHCAPLRNRPRPSRPLTQHFLRDTHRRAPGAEIDERRAARARNLQCHGNVEELETQSSGRFHLPEDGRHFGLRSGTLVRRREAGSSQPVRTRSRDEAGTDSPRSSAASYLERAMHEHAATSARRPWTGKERLE